MRVSGLPASLLQPFAVGDEVALKVMLDLTVYLDGPTESEFEYLFDLYESICPAGLLRRFKIAELPMWSGLDDPILTMHARAAAAEGIKRPYFQAVRERIRQGRGFEAQYWDGRTIDDMSGSWSFNCQRLRLRPENFFTFARLLVPLDTELDVLLNTAAAIADNVPVRSGHGGLVFVYEPLLMEDAFEVIYARARRFWGVDVEHMNGTLPLTGDHIKGVNWITLVGRRFAADPAVAPALGQLGGSQGVTKAQRRNATIIVAGQQPVAGDRNRRDDSLAPYFAIADALEPLFLTDHPDFPGELFEENANTMGWIRRFLDAPGWA